MLEKLSQYVKRYNINIYLEIAIHIILLEREKMIKFTKKYCSFNSNFSNYYFTNTKINFK